MRNDWPDVKLPEGCSLLAVPYPSDEEVTITLITKEGFFAQCTVSQDSYKRYDQEEQALTVQELHQIAVTEAQVMVEELVNTALYGNPHGPVHQPTPRGIMESKPITQDDVENSYGLLDKDDMTPAEKRQAELAKLPFREFYITTAANHPGGAGYWKVRARDRHECREVAFKHLDAKWAFDYERLEDIHPLDRERCHGTLT